MACAVETRYGRFRVRHPSLLPAVLECVRTLDRVSGSRAYIERRDCGTGAGGFKPGNKCGGEGGGGADSGSGSGGGAGDSGGGSELGESKAGSHSTVADAESYARKSIARRVDYSGISDPKMANIANSQLESLSSDYGVRLDSVSTSDSMDDSVIAEAYVFTSKKTVGGKQVEERTVGISLNQKWFESESKYRAMLAEKGVSEGDFFGAGRPRSVLNHEFGHLVDRRENRAATQEIFERRKKDLPMLSSYAQSSRSEMMAEAFSAYRALGSLANVGGVDLSELEPYFKPRN